MPGGGIVYMAGTPERFEGFLASEDSRLRVVSKLVREERPCTGARLQHTESHQGHVNSRLPLFDLVSGLLVRAREAGRTLHLGDFQNSSAVAPRRAGGKPQKGKGQNAIPNPRDSKFHDARLHRRHRHSGCWAAAEYCRHRPRDRASQNPVSRIMRRILSGHTSIYLYLLRVLPWLHLAPSRNFSDRFRCCERSQRIATA